MTTWDKRYRDFGRNCIRNFNSLRKKAARAGTETSLYIQTCTALFIVLYENAKATPPNELQIDERAVADLVGLHVTTTTGSAADAVECTRHAFAHFNVGLLPEVAPASRPKQITGLRLASKWQLGKKKGHVRWAGEVQLAGLKALIDGLVRLWPK